MAQEVKGRATIRIAAILLLASAVFEIMEFNSPVVIFGNVRTGALLVVYHLVFVALYFFSGIGLWTGKPWGYWAIMATTTIYTLDKVQLILFPDAFYDHILHQLTVTREMVGMIPRDQLLFYFMVAHAALVLCWWGFAFYIHLRRHYFQERPL